MARQSNRSVPAPKTGLESKECLAMVKRAREAADRALARYGEPTMSLEELQRILDEKLGGISLSEEIVRQREAGW